MTVPGSHSQERPRLVLASCTAYPWGTVGPQANLDHSSPWVTCWAGQDSSGFLAQGEKQLTECVTRARIHNILSERARVLASERKAAGSALAGCVTSGRSLHLSEPLFTFRRDEKPPAGLVWTECVADPRAPCKLPSAASISPLLSCLAGPSHNRLSSVPPRRPAMLGTDRQPGGRGEFAAVVTRRGVEGGCGR